MDNMSQQANPEFSTPNPPIRDIINNHRRNFPIAIGVVLLLLIVAVGAYYLGTQTQNSNQTNQYTQQLTPTPSNSQPTSIPTTNQASSVDIPSSWKTFTSKTEGFTIRYPDNWTVQDTSSGNCAHTSGTSTPNGFCRDRFDFISPDGLIVRYVIHKDENNDKISCGIQSSCDTQNVYNLETLNIATMGEVLLVEQDKEINLHKPIDNDTLPVVGPNKHSNYMIDFTLPSKTGGRFALFVPSPNPETKFDKLTSEQFYSNDSVKQAILILKSLKY